MRIAFRLSLAALLLLPGIDRAAASVIAASAAAAAARGARVAPVPAASINARLGSAVSAPGARMSVSVAPSLKATLAPALSVAPGLNAALAPASARFSGPAAAASPAAAAPAQLRALPAPPGTPAARAQGRAAAAGKAPMRGALAQTGERLARKSGLGAVLGKLFDGFGDLMNASFVDGPEAARPPDWGEDQRIERAFRRLSDSAVGKDLYAYVYNQYGATLKLRVDDAPGAKYEARLAWENGQPVIYLAESMVDRQSPEVAAAYLARELSEAYFKDFPESADRNYMSFSNMVRVYAELTDSGLSRYGHWWDTGRDQWTGDAYAMQRYYGSWKEAVAEQSRGGKAVRSSAFFEFLRQWGGDNLGQDSRLTLTQLYRSGRISYAKYREMNEYFQQFVGSEESWFSQTGRW